MIFIFPIWYCCSCCFFYYMYMYSKLYITFSLPSGSYLCPSTPLWLFASAPTRFYSAVSYCLQSIHACCIQMSRLHQSSPCPFSSAPAAADHSLLPPSLIFSAHQTAHPHQTHPVSSRYFINITYSWKRKYFFLHEHHCSKIFFIWKRNQYLKKSRSLHVWLQVKQILFIQQCTILLLSHILRS